MTHQASSLPAQQETTREEQIRERLERATPGPWRYCGCGKCGLVWQPTADFVVAIAREGGEDHEAGPRLKEKIANAELIAHAPGDLRYLLERLSSLEADRQDATVRAMLAEALAMHVDPTTLDARERPVWDDIHRRRNPENYFPEATP